MESIKIQIEIYSDVGQLRYVVKAPGYIYDSGVPDEQSVGGTEDKSNWLKKELLYEISNIDFKGIISKQF